MQEKEEKQGPLESLMEKVEDYGKTQMELATLKLTEKTANVVSALVSKLLAVLLLFLFISMASVGVSLWLGGLLGKLMYGFFCVSGFYALAGLVLLLVPNNWLRKRVNESIITQALN